LNLFSFFSLFSDFSADPLQAIDLHLRFSTKEDAIRFAERNNMDYTIVATNKTKLSVTKRYADNFKYQPKKLRLVHTK